MSHAPDAARPVVVPNPTWAIVMNPRSGAQDSGALRSQIEDTLRASGAEPRWFVPERGAGLPDMAARAAASGASTVLAVGGDGTVNTVAQALWSSSQRHAAIAANPAALPPRMAIVPGGTFNHIARRYGIPTEVQAALAQALADNGTDDIPGVLLGGGSVNGRLFLNNCSFGAYTTLIEAREAHKKRFGRYRVVAALSALSVLAQPHRRRAMVLTQGKQRTTLRASLVFVAANPVQVETLAPDLARTIERGSLGLLAVRAPGIGGLLHTAWQSLWRRTDELDELAVELLADARISLGAPRLRAVIDGEIVTLSTPLELRAVPQAVRLRGAAAPRADTGSEAARAQNGAPQSL
jgi:diacylglycerol kinase family enzyme